MHLFHSIGLGFLLNGVIYSNNSLITTHDIGNRFTGPALFCLTPNTQCCNANIHGEWYLPDGTPVSSSNTSLSICQVPSAVSLYLGAPIYPWPSGVFLCEIPDASGSRQNIYVGIYPQAYYGEIDQDTVLLLLYCTCTTYLHTYLFQLAI